MLENGDTIDFEDAKEQFELEHWGGEESRYVLIDNENGVEYKVGINDLVVNRVDEFDL